MTHKARQKAHVEFTLNGEAVEVAFAPHKTLLEVLREVVTAGGFQRFRRAAETPFNIVYEARP